MALYGGRSNLRRALAELRNVTPVPQLGGGELTITGAVKFVGETPCTSGRANQRCVNLQAETGPDKAQSSRLIQSLLRQAGANRPVITFWDQRFKADIVVDKATMLPQQLTITRLHTFNLRMQGQDEGLSEEITKTYTFTWLLPGDKPKKIGAMSCHTHMQEVGGENYFQARKFFERISLGGNLKQRSDKLRLNPN